MKTSSGRCKHVAVFVSSKPKKDDKTPRSRTQSGTAERGELGRACEGSVCELKHTYLTPARRLHLQLACQL